LPDRWKRLKSAQAVEQKPRSTPRRRKQLLAFLSCMRMAVHAGCSSHFAMHCIKVKVLSMMGFVSSLTEYAPRNGPGLLVKQFLWE